MSSSLTSLTSGISPASIHPQRRRGRTPRLHAEHILPARDINGMPEGPTGGMSHTGKARTRTPSIRRPPAGEVGHLELDLGLCLSGGGFRAMLFHAGSLWRLNEAGYLSRLDRVSSVSGGSITAAMLALRWEELEFAADGRTEGFVELVLEPLRRFASRTVDVPAVVVGLLLPGVTINGRLTRSYRRLFARSTLSDLPARPDFVFDATNLQSGDLWRFSRRQEGDWRVGSRATPDTEIARVVAASSAFPPLLAPSRLEFNDDVLQAGGDPEVSSPPYTTRVVLADGGVYDNLGLEAVWTTCRQVLISDAGGQMSAERRPRSFWPLQVLRVLHVIDNQVRELRKRQAVQSYIEGQRTGAYWGIRSDVSDFGLPDPIASPTQAQVRGLAGVPTRLAGLGTGLQEQLINWGYVMCDTALRAHVAPDQPPGRLPYPGAGLG
ncbi:MAG TPA: patatin-like phospholipase family protein [Solirubrobacteraceae bacterium]|nr:patatin-like phospholipase family protein [Solirubrobacteraceae bacterium]